MRYIADISCHVWVFRKADWCETDSFFLLNFTGLNLLQGSWELGPVTHDDDGAGVPQDLLHLGLLVLSIRTDVANHFDAGASSAQGTALAVLDRDALLGLLAKLLYSVEVDGGVGLAGGLLKTCGSREDDVTGEVLVLSNLFDRGADTAESRRGNNGKLVLVGSGELLELLVDTGARSEGLLELGNDSILLLENIGLEVLGGDLDVVEFLERKEHAAEVLTDELLDQSLASETDLKLTALTDLVDKAGAGLEGELLGEDEGVVAVEQESGDLASCQLKLDHQRGKYFD